jgi:superfamily II DNA or RNA helicase
METTPLLLGYNDLDAAQKRAVEFMLNGDYSLIVGNMGSGKTITTLTAITELLDSGDCARVLVVATKKICQTVWAQDAARWDHTRHLTINRAVGTPAKRCAAINEPSDIVLLNYENVPWFHDTYKVHNFDAVVFDEITKVSPSSQILKRFRRRLAPFKWRVGLTADPVPENFLNLYSQMLVLDDGAALGTNFDEYKQEYFRPVDYEQKIWQLRKGGGEKILEKVQYSIFILPDYRHQLPKFKVEFVPVLWSKKTRERYEQFAREMVLKMPVASVVAVNSGVLSQKLHQFTQGFMYAGEDVIELHRAKSRALTHLLDCRLLNKNCLIVYWFKEDCARLLELLPGAHILRPDNTEEVIKDWNAGKIQHLLIHPRSAGHGLNLERGACNIIWYSQYWSRDLWNQTNGRLWRRGQFEDVTAWVLFAVDGIDPILYATVQDKGRFDALFFDHLATFLKT